MENYLQIHGSGTFKQCYTRKMIAENITVPNAFYSAKETEVLTKQPKGQSCMHFQTKVMHVPVTDRKLEDEGIVKAIHETRLIHAVRSLRTLGLVKIRHFDCCCGPCIHNTDNFIVKQADDWQVVVTRRSDENLKKREIDSLWISTNELESASKIVMENIQEENVMENQDVMENGRLS